MVRAAYGLAGAHRDVDAPDYGDVLTAMNGGAPPPQRGDSQVGRALKWLVDPIEPIKEFKETGVAPMQRLTADMEALANSPNSGFFTRWAAQMTMGKAAYNVGAVEAGFPDSPLDIAATLVGVPGAAAELRALNAMVRREAVTEAAQSGRALGTVEDLQFWNEAKVFGNDKLGFRRVYQRDDLFDPHAVVDEMSNLDRMSKGRPPIGHDGQRVNLHHLTQNEPGALAEVGGKFHSDNSSVLHGLTENKSSFRYSADGVLTEAEKAFNRYKYWYWQQRAQGF